MHTHGFFRAFAKPLWLHARDYLRSPEYRAMHRFTRQVRGVDRSQAKVVRFAGREIVVPDGPSFLSAWDEIFVNRIYDIGDVTRPPLLVDVGANIGLAALYWKHRYREFRYLGFEADPDIAAACRQNLAAWQVTGELQEAAVTAKDGTVIFQSEGNDAGRVVPLGANGHAREVRAVRLGRHLTEPIDLLKLDIEGTEFEVLSDIENQLAHVRNLFIEVHSTPDYGHSLSFVLTILERQGFHCHVQVGFGSARPFAERMISPTGFEAMVNVFGVRERR